jgi:hypothetical protein
MIKVYRNVRDLIGEENFTKDSYETIKEYMNRMIVLSDLYLRPIKKPMKGFVDSLDELDRLHKRCHTFCNSSDEVSAEQIDEAFNQIRRGADICRKEYDNLKYEIEKLTR